MKQQRPTVKKKFPVYLILAIYQLAGGLLGLGFFIKMIPGLVNPSLSTWVGILLAALLYIFSILCGFLLFQGTRRAFTLSLANQILQVFSFGTAGVAYNYVAGLKLGLGIDFLESWVFKFRMSLSSFNFSFGVATGLSFVSINLLALVLLYLLEKSREEAQSS